ncbi:DMT family transporter [Microcella daejeonensis]|uniref:DMT family transporter n=1 Tax=Microcella daejeonensis TaxID=2994971 RepID=UPI002270824E|nr:DMT family transporter [Microcella daejeonensis]WAB85203.1 DMT family transporter [Microcella daejeonensis]
MPAAPAQPAATARGPLRRYSPPVLAQLFWASNFVVAALVVDEFSPLELTFLRWVGALPILLVLAQLIERPQWRAAMREWPRHLLQAALGMVGYTLFLYAALATTSPVTASVISAINPAVIAIAAVIVLGERIMALGIAGIVVSFVGVLVVVLTGQGGGELAFSSGDLLMLGAIAVWTAYVILGRRQATPPITATAIQAGMSILLLGPVLAIVGFTATPSAEGWLGLAWIIVFPSALAYLFWNIAVSTLGPSRTGVFLNLLPVFTALIALLFGEVITIGQVVGGLIVLAGVSLTTRPGATRAGPEQPAPSIPSRDLDAR